MLGRKTASRFRRRPRSKPNVSQQNCPLLLWLPLDEAAGLRLQESAFDGRFRDAEVLGHLALAGLKAPAFDVLDDEEDKLQLLFGRRRVGRRRHRGTPYRLVAYVKWVFCRNQAGMTKLGLFQMKSHV